MRIQKYGEACFANDNKIENGLIEDIKVFSYLTTG